MNAGGPLAGRAYLRLIFLGAAIGIPAALVAAALLAAVHELEDVLWHDLPDWLGYSSTPWFLVIGLPVVGGALVAVVRRRLPGDGGHSPLQGIGLGETALAGARGSRSPPSPRSASAQCWAPRRR